MSQEQAEKKKAEIEALEAQEKQDRKDIESDFCPHCGQSTKSYPYICFLPSPFGWVECAACGVIFSPKSIRFQKIAMAKKNVMAPGQSIVITQ